MSSDPNPSLGSAGFGNKTKPSDTSHLDHSDTRFGTHLSHDPYSGATEHGSGATGGAGWGNKTSDGHGEKHDSMAGKVMEKVGNMVHNQGMVEKGREKREAQGFGTETTT